MIPDFKCIAIYNLFFLQSFRQQSCWETHISETLQVISRSPQQKQMMQRSKLDELGDFLVYPQMVSMLVYGLIIV